MSIWPGSPAHVAREREERRRLESVERWAQDLVRTARVRTAIGLEPVPLADVNALARALGQPEISTHATTEVRK